MQIRSMTAADRKSVIPMAEAFYHSPAVEHAAPQDIIAKTFEDAVGSNPHLEGFLLEEAGQPIGFAYLTHFYSCEVAGNVIMIEELFIKDECRGKGCGQQFMDWMYAAYPETVRFRLEITPENRAVNLYLRNGFRDYPYGQMVLDRKQ